MLPQTSSGSVPGSGSGSGVEDRLGLRLAVAVNRAARAVEDLDGRLLGLYLIRRGGELHRLETSAEPVVPGPAFLPLPDVVDSLNAAEAWEDLRMLAFEQVRHTPLAAHLADELAIVGSLVVVPLRHDDARLYGHALVTFPRHPHDLGAHRLRTLADDLDQTGREIHRLQHQAGLARGAALTDAVRRIVRRASEHDDVVPLLAGVVRDATQLGAPDAWISTHDDPPIREATAGVAEGLAEGEAGRTLAPVARAAWRRQEVALVSPRRLSRGVDDVSVRRLLPELAIHDVDSMVVLPLGAGSRCVGHLVLARSSAESDWLDAELDILLDLAHALGQTLVHLRTLAAERRVNEDLRERDRHRAEFVAALVHELRSPLTALRSNLELIDPHRDTTTTAALRAALGASGRMSALVDDLVDLVRAGSVDASRHRPIEVGPVVRQSTITTAELAGGGHRVRLHLPPGPLWARTDPRDLDLLVCNLVGNALKYSEGQVHVMLSRTPASGSDGPGDAGQCVIEVVDSGPGIAPEDQERIFEEFYRGTAQEVRRRPGSGLGLAIVRTIVERHGGSVTVESVPGEGSTFIARLPGAIPFAPSPPWVPAD